jgi:hypothetical protein|tara:strand:+ start:317 stop:727 length:411 start_codon:yes stop_codon:yes gene_type:complete
MITYTKLPIEKIHYLDRPEFHKEEIKFKTSLLNSMKKYGMIDPIYAEYGHRYGKIIKVIVGNNRMTAAKILGYKKVPIIINSYDPNYKPEGRELKSDDEIRALFKLGKDLQIRRNKDGMIDQIMPPGYNKVQKEYE